MPRFRHTQDETAAKLSGRRPALRAQDAANGLPAHLNIREAAGYLGISPHTLYKLVERRKVPAAKIGGSWRLNRAALDQFIAAASAPGNPRVLVVESDAGERSRLVRDMARRSSMVGAASSYGEALEQAQAIRPDIVFLAVPPGAGRDTAAFVGQLRAVGVGSRVAFMVDPDDAQAIASVLDQGPALFLRRPVGREDLLTILTLISR